MASQEQLLNRQIVPANISQRLWDINLEGDTWVCRGKINFNLWFLDAATSNSITRILHLMKRNCKNLLEQFIEEKRQPIVFTLGVVYKTITRNGVDPHFLSGCTSDKIQPEISLWQECQILMNPMTNFNQDYESAAMNLIQKLFQQFSNPVLEGCYNTEITSFSIHYKTLSDDCSPSTNDDNSQLSTHLSTLKLNY